MLYCKYQRRRIFGVWDNRNGLFEFYVKTFVYEVANEDHKE